MRHRRLAPIAAALAALLALAACERAALVGPRPEILPSPAPCVAPADLAPAAPYDPPVDEIVRDVAPAFHMLAVSWSPEACRSGKDYPDPARQCRDGRFGLTLHGLWPNGAAGRHPRYCAAPGPAIPVETVRRHFCMTPSPALLQHEWAAHGTCGWTDPEAYFQQAATLWNALRKPDLEAIPAERLTAGAIRDAFVSANPGLPRAAIHIARTDGWFREARLCYGLDYAPIPCPSSLGAPDEERLKLAPRAPQTGR